MTAVASDGLALPHCHQSLRADRDVVLCAVSSALAIQLFESAISCCFGSHSGGRPPPKM